MLKRSKTSEELAQVSQCIQEAKERISKQQERVDRAASHGLLAYEERGVLFIMIERLETMMKRRARLIRGLDDPGSDTRPDPRYAAS